MFRRLAYALLFIPLLPVRIPVMVLLFVGDVLLLVPRWIVTGKGGGVLLNWLGDETRFYEWPMKKEARLTKGGQA